ncbi:MAG: 4Fe-4S ferredoxin, partial [Salinivirgaceae bacterium]
AEPYNEILVIEEMEPKGRNTIKAHLIHMKEHKEFGFMKQGVKWLRENRDKVNFDVDALIKEVHNYGQEPELKINATQMKVAHQGGCPGSQARSFKPKMQMAANDNNQTPNQKSQITNTSGQSALQQWPVQMHLLNPNAEYIQNSDLLLAADCTAYSMGNFHSFLEGKSLAIACPKLDSGKEIYVEKLQAMIDIAKVNTITVLKMEVPCCGGLVQLVQTALRLSKRYVPVKIMVVSIQGEVISEEWAPPVNQQIS